MRQANIAPFGLRMQPELRDRVADAARRNNRSMNSEIVHRLQGGLDREADGSLPVWLPTDLRQRIEDQASRDELDPNLLIVSALEEAFPKEQSLAETYRLVAQQIELEAKAAPAERREQLALSLEVLEHLIAQENEKERDEANRPLPWGKSE